MKAKEFLQDKYPQMRGRKWNTHDVINDNWTAQMMQEYAEHYHALQSPPKDVGVSEVWQKWIELDNAKFDNWLHDKVNNPTPSIESEQKVSDEEIEERMNVYDDMDDYECEAAAGFELGAKWMRTRMLSLNPSKVFANNQYPIRSKDLKGNQEEFSEDVITFSKDDILNIGYYNYDTEKWDFHSDTLVDPYENGKLMDFVWMYKPCELKIKTT